MNCRQFDAATNLLNADHRMDCETSAYTALFLGAIFMALAFVPGLLGITRPGVGRSMDATDQIPVEALLICNLQHKLDYRLR